MVINSLKNFHSGAKKKCYIIIDKTENVQSMSSSTFFGIERQFLAMNGDHLSSERAGGTMTLPTYGKPPGAGAP